MQTSQQIVVQKCAVSPEIHLHRGCQKKGPALLPFARAEGISLIDFQTRITSSILFIYIHTMPETEPPSRSPQNWRERALELMNTKDSIEAELTALAEDLNR
jgi:hypothetical protein